MPGLLDSTFGVLFCLVSFVQPEQGLPYSPALSLLVGLLSGYLVLSCDAVACLRGSPLLSFFASVSGSPKEKTKEEKMIHQRKPAQRNDKTQIKSKTR
jgi:hypothetical protein